MYLPGRGARPLPIPSRDGIMDPNQPPVVSTPMPPPAPVAPPMVPMGGITGGNPNPPPMGGGSSVPPMFGGFRNPVAPGLSNTPLPVTPGTGIAPGLRKAPRPVARPMPAPPLGGAKGRGRY